MSKRSDVSSQRIDAREGEDGQGGTGSSAERGGSPFSSSIIFAKNLTSTYGQGFKLRPLTMDDFVLHDSHAYAHVESSRRTPGAYAEALD